MSAHTVRACLVVLLAGALPSAHAEPRVVADTACPLYAVDIAAFATCDGDHAAAFGGDDLASAFLAQAAVPATKRNAAGLYIDALHAYQLKRDHPQAVVLLDVRTRLEVGFVGQPLGVDLHVPFLDTATPLAWDEEQGGWAMTSNPAFAHQVDERLARLGVARDTPLLVLCRDGERSGRAADALAALGYTQAISVVDGFEGDLGPDGRRSVNGWKNAGMPWTARPMAALVYGAR